MTLTAEQVALRQTFIGASEVGAVIGESPFATPLDIYLRKTGRAPDREDTEWTWFGNRLEAVIAELYSRRLQVELVTCATLRHPEWPCIGATPDRVTDAEGQRPRLVQIKARSYADPALWGEPDTDEIPFDTLAQATQEMAVWNAQPNRPPVKETDVVTFFRINDVRIYCVAFDPDLWEMLSERLRTFWERHIVADVPPPLDGSRACHEYLARRYPAHEALMLQADPETAMLVESYAEARDVEHEAQDHRSRLEAELKARTGEAQGIYAAAGTFTWKRTAGAGTDWKVVAEAAGASAELIAAHQRAGFRRVHFSPSKLRRTA